MEPAKRRSGATAGRQRQFRDRPRHSGRRAGRPDRCTRARRSTTCRDHLGQHAADGEPDHAERPANQPARFTRITIYGDAVVCQKYRGVASGSEPVLIGDGADGVNRIYNSSDITYR
jgi:hypothetical protein